MKNKLYSLAASSAFCLLLSACAGGGGSSTNNDTGNTINTGKGLAECPTETTEAVICGTVYAADGATPLTGAQITTTSNANKSLLRGVVNDSACMTDAKGEFACVFDGVLGETTFTAQKEGFDPITFTTNLAEGIVANIKPIDLPANNSEKWLVIPGTYDGVQVLLSQLKDCTLNDLSGAPIADITTFAAHNARGSADCESKGLTVLDDVDVSSTLLDTTGYSAYNKIFVNCGSSFYAGTLGESESVPSLTIEAAHLLDFVDNGGDLYFSDLESSNVATMFPGMISFNNATTVGDITANVTHAGLESALGSTVDLKFDLWSWSVLESIGSGVTTFIQGDVSALTGVSETNTPITVGWQKDADSAKGCTLYTSYHVEGGSVGADQELALKYIIQNVDGATNCQ